MKAFFWVLMVSMAFLLCLVLAVACGDDDDDDNAAAGDDDDDDGVQVENISDSGCKNDVKSKTGVDIGWLEFTYENGVLTIVHHDSVFNCCYDSIDVTAELSGFDLDIYEQENTPQPCDCICPVDVTYEISDLADGTYTVTVYVNGDYGTQNDVTIP